MFPGYEILLPALSGEGALLGMRFGDKTTLAGERSHWDVYHKLVRETVSDIL